MLNFSNVSFSYGKKEVLRNFSMHLEKGEILALMGPSGCGKTTILSLISGLLRPTSGELLNRSEKISIVFQEPRLFPWCTVAENLRAVIRDREVSNHEIEALLGTFGLQEAKDLYPEELSGGMKSRVSLARAWLFGGDLFLLDEPFAALDPEMRISLAKRLREELKSCGASAILVTHQEDVANLLSDRILRLP